MTKKEKIKTKDWTYNGEVKNGEPHGDGIMKFKNGEKLEGCWKNGNPIKAYKYILYSNEKKDMRYEYEGTLGWGKGGVLNGKGIFKIIDKVSKPKGYTYLKGNFVGALLEGKGIRILYYDKNYSRAINLYKGEFKNGFQHGKGIEWFYPNKYFSEGIFKNNKFKGSKQKPLTKKVFKLILDANNINK